MILGVERIKVYQVIICQIISLVGSLWHSLHF
jgi:hypothetical protein